jgi:hypothetical protein
MTAVGEAHIEVIRYHQSLGLVVLRWRRRLATAAIGTLGSLSGPRN